MLDQLIGQIRQEALVGAIVALLVIGLLGGHLYVLRPSIRDYREISQARRAASLELEATGEGADQALIAAEAARVARLRDQLYGGSSGVPLEQMESYVIGALDRISARYEVELRGVRPEEMTQVLMFGELPYDVEVQGSYFSLFEWLQDVEEELRPMVVKEFRIDRNGGADQVSLGLRLVAYRTGGAEG